MRPAWHQQAIDLFNSGLTVHKVGLILDQTWWATWYAIHRSAAALGTEHVPFSKDRLEHRRARSREYMRRLRERRRSQRMALSEQIDAYRDCFKLFERAIGAEFGVRVLLATEQAARYFQMRMSQARALERKQNKRVYPQDDPKWGTSEFDTLIVRIREAAEKDGTWWVYVEPQGIEISEVEELDHETRTGA